MNYFFLSEIYKKVDIDRKLFSKIRCSNTYIPRRNVIIKLCLALGLNKYDFNKLLNSAGYSLSNNLFDFGTTSQPQPLLWYSAHRGVPC